ncbi:MAG TPA: hypothetical protein DDW34_11285 [Clostridium sp.]|nr:hypothetical protein [Clostridium sp.]
MKSKRLKTKTLGFAKGIKTLGFAQTHLLFEKSKTKNFYETRIDMRVSIGYGTIYVLAVIIYLLLWLFIAHLLSLYNLIPHFSGYR